MTPEDLDDLLAVAAAAARARNAADRNSEHCPAAGADEAVPPEERYRVVSNLGSGGSSRVYLVAVVCAGGAEVEAAMKRVAVPASGGGQLEVAAVRAVLAELHALEVCRHRSVPRLLDTFRDCDTGDVCLVMTVARGRDLMAMLQERGRPFPQDDVLRWAGLLLGPLRELHARGIVYTDLKPENIVVDAESGALSLVDFGLCFVAPPAGGSHLPPSAVSEALETEELRRAMLLTDKDGPSFWGTAEYAAPEVIEGGVASFSAASDYWALGVLIYELLYGRTPFRAHSAEAVFLAIRTRGPQFPESVQVGVEAQQLMRGLMRHKAEYRLGAGGPGEVEGHPAFRRVDGGDDE